MVVQEDKEEEDVSSNQSGFPLSSEPPRERTGVGAKTQVFARKGRVLAGDEWSRGPLFQGLNNLPQHWSVVS